MFTCLKSDQPTSEQKAALEKGGKAATEQQKALDKSREELATEKLRNSGLAKELELLKASSLEKGKAARRGSEEAQMTAAALTGYGPVWLWPIQLWPV